MIKTIQAVMASDQVQKEQSLKWRLHQALCVMDPPRSRKIIHASSLTSKASYEFCPREHVIRRITANEGKKKFVTTSESLTFEIGRIVQEKIVNTFAELGLAIGDWRCINCKTLYQYQKRPVKCVKCYCKSFKPEEMRFRSKISGASCGLDMVVDLGFATYIPVEIKTIDKDEFKELVTMLAEHRERTKLYLRIIAESDDDFSKMINTDEARVLYASKGGYGTKDPQLQDWDLWERFSPFKEYSVERDDEAVQHLHDKAKSATDFIENGAGMPEGICPNAFCSRAKYCAVLKECWSGDFPVGVPLAP